MTKRFKVILIVLIILSVIVTSYAVQSCYGLTSRYRVKRFLRKNRKDIEIVVDYLKELQYDDVFVDDNDGMITYGKNVKDNEGIENYVIIHTEISSQEVVSSIKNLWKAGCELINKDGRHGNKNTINIQIWHGKLGGAVGGNRMYGLACTINGQGMPMAEFQTKCEVIENGWFYYYSDFEEWRLDPDKYRGLFGFD